MALSFIKSSGNIITEDFCMALANETKADYVKDKSFGLEMKKVDDVIASTFEKLRERWEENRAQIIGNDFDNATLRKKWVLPFLEALGYQPVFIAHNIKSESGTEYQIPYKGWDSEYAPLIHMVNSVQDFDTKDKQSRTHSNKSPQDCLQQLLNTSHHQWAILINGKKVRLLRDFYHSITKGFLEFDLESIFETANSEQFRVLFRILHSSRIENQYQGKQEIEYDEEGNPIEVEDNCLLESFHKKSRETGVKVGNKLRDQVIEAIEKLGNGFAESLDPDEFQNGKVKGFYAEILNIIYRLLFLMFAEQKGWLPVRNSIYARTYSLNALREMAERGNYSHDEEHDLWEGLKITFKLVANGYKFKNGDEINAFGGQLFSDKKIGVIKDLSLKNKFLLDAIFRLSYFKLDNLSNRINYANLAIDELGSVYESLLDYEPKLAKEPITINKREIKRGEFYLDDRGTDRKTTGSYYTDSRLVAQLIESALVPVINNALTGKNTIEEKEQALLDLKVADIACGSGAFICAALEKMGEQLALIRMGDEERPTEDQLREAKRDVLLHCIYGVDLNPMALELAKFSLWITASLPDMPLTFLDHKLKCGNSLIGATPDLIKKGIPEEAYKPVGNDNAAICTKLKQKVRREQESLNRVNEPTTQYGLQFKRNETDELLRLREVLNNRKQEEVADVDLAEEEYHQLEKMERKFKDWLMADVWTSAFFIEKTELDQTLYPTNVTLENLRENQPVNDVLIDRVLKTADDYNFFHYHLEFPEVFEEGGFDCLLGNPPWERIRMQEKEFFKSRNSKISNTKSKAKRNKLISNLSIENPILFEEYLAAKSVAEKNSLFLLQSQLYPLTGKGDVNTYTVFAEGFRMKISKRGRAGIITPTGIATDDLTKDFFRSIVETKQLVSLYDFENRKKLFNGVDSRFKFCLLTLNGTENLVPFDFLFFGLEPNDLLDENRHFSLTKEELLELNPNTGNCPIFRTKRDAVIVKSIYKRLPILVDEINEINHYRIFLRQGLYHMTIDSTAGYIKEANEHNFNDPVYLYEGKMMYQYDNLFSSYSVESDEYVAINKSQITNSVGQYVVERKDLLDRCLMNEWNYKWFFVYRNITNTTNERTVIASVIPFYAPVFSLRVMFGFEKEHSILFLANMNSFALDFIVRNKMGGTNLSDYIMKQIPFITIEYYTSKLISEIRRRVLELQYTNEDIKEYAIDMGILTETFPWNEKHRFKLQCELDAVYAHLYGLEKEEMDYILETFPIVKRKDIAKYGSYRTKETILQLYDEFAWVRDEINKTKTINV
jgi:hypothetical protein